MNLYETVDMLNVDVKDKIKDYFKLIDVLFETKGIRRFFNIYERHILIYKYGIKCDINPRGIEFSDKDIQNLLLMNQNEIKEFESSAIKKIDDFMIKHSSIANNVNTLVNYFKSLDDLDVGILIITPFNEDLNYFKLNLNDFVYEDNYLKTVYKEGQLIVAIKDLSRHISTIIERYQSSQITLINTRNSNVFAHGDDVSEPIQLDNNHYVMLSNLLGFKILEVKYALMLRKTPQGLINTMMRYLYTPLMSSIHNAYSDPLSDVLETEDLKKSNNELLEVILNQVFTDKNRDKFINNNIDKVYKKLRRRPRNDS